MKSCRVGKNHIVVTHVNKHRKRLEEVEMGLLVFIKSLTEHAGSYRQTVTHMRISYKRPVDLSKLALGLRFCGAVQNKQRPKLLCERANCWTPNANFFALFLQT